MYPLFLPKRVLPAPEHKRMTHKQPNEHRNSNKMNNSTPKRETRSRRNSGRRASTSNCNRESISAAAFQNSILATRPALVTTGTWPRTAARPMPLRLSPSIARRGEGRVSTRLRSDRTFPDNSAGETARSRTDAGQKSYFIVCCSEEGSSSRIHSTTESGRLPFLTKSSWN